MKANNIQLVNELASEILVDICDDKDIVEAMMERTGGTSVYLPHFKAIVLSDKLRGEKRLWVLLHEMGHHILQTTNDEDQTKWYTIMKQVESHRPYFYRKLRDHELRMEYKAWDVAVEMAIELNAKGANFNIEAMIEHAERNLNTYHTYYRKTDRMLSAFNIDRLRFVKTKNDETEIFAR